MTQAPIRRRPGTPCVEGEGRGARATLPVQHDLSDRVVVHPPGSCHRTRARDPRLIEGGGGARAHLAFAYRTAEEPPRRLRDPMYLVHVTFNSATVCARRKD